MKRRWILLIGVLAVSLSLCASALAEEAPETAPGSALGGLIGSLLGDGEVSEKLFGEDGIITGALPEGVDLNGIAESFGEQIGALEAQGEKVMEYIRENVQNPDGSFSLDGSAAQKLEDLAGLLVGAITGGGDDAFDALDGLLAKYGALNEAEEEYVLGMDSEFMEPGDVQLMSSFRMAVNDEDLEGDEVKSLLYVCRTNYTADGSVLRLLCGSDSPFLFTSQWDEESGTYTVIDARETADGEEWAASFEAMCAEVGYDVEEGLLDIEYAKAFHIEEMTKYLNEHPEYEGMEFEGEIKTAEELDAIEWERLLALEPEPAGE